MKNKIIYSLFAFVISFNCISQTVDFNFTTNNNSFCNPQSVTFTQNCTGNPESFIWNFGNGITGSNATEVVNYLVAGTYTVTLTATFNNSAISVNKTITINPTPAISISADRTYLCQPGIINFTVNSSVALSNVSWDFGDGNISTTNAVNTISHNFASYNTFTVKAICTTAQGCTSSSTLTVQVTKIPISGSISPNSGCIPTLSTFLANITLPTGDVAQSFVWNFGDASNATTVSNSTTHNFNITTPITNASVLVTSLQGCVNQFNFPTFAFGTPPTNISVSTTSGRDTFCGSETISFNANANNANYYKWNFGDGTFLNSTANSVTHKYDTLGLKKIIVTPYFNGCVGAKDSIVIFITGVYAKYKFSNNCNSKNQYFYTNNSTGNISKFYWTFNDISSQIDSVNYNPTHIFPNNGSFSTKLKVYDALTGCSDSLTTYQFTAIPTISSNVIKSCKDSLVTYTVNNSYNSNSGYNYSFHANGIVSNPSIDTSFTFAATNYGVFNDYVVITDPSQIVCNDTIRLSNSLSVSGPIANFTTPILNQCFYLNNFPITNNSYPYINTESLIKWQWDFGDNTKDSIFSPSTHKYINPGNYTISLIVSDINNCKQKKIQSVKVFAMPHIKIYPKLDTLCLGQTSTLTAFTLDTLLWIPATNLTCNNCDTVIASPIYTTTYIGQAKNQYGCISNDTSKIKVYRPISLNPTPIDTNVCPKQLVQLQANTNGITIWSPSTYLNATNIPNPVSIPDSSITYSLIIKDSVGCFSDTTKVNIYTFPKPTIDAGLDITVPYNSIFTLNPIIGNNISSFIWSPLNNNLNCSTCINPKGIALQTQIYNLEATSVNGCKASDEVTVYVKCEQSNLYVPTAFTPNNDGVNDYFGPITRGYKIINKLIIYDRWGKKVFEKNNFTPNIPALTWNGKTNNNQVFDNQTFIWYIEATCDLGMTISKKGTVTLIK